MKEEKPNYYAVIPATVRYDKTLPMGARLLYGEISALANKTGFCWAENDYFAQLYDVDVKTISRWLNKLSAQQHINTNDVNGERQICLIGTKMSMTDKNVHVLDKNVHVLDKNVHKNESDFPKDGSTKAQKDDVATPNITINNTINRDGSVETSSTPRDALNELPYSLGKLPIHRLVGVYNIFWKAKYGTENVRTNWGQLGRLYKPLFGLMNEWQIAGLICIHFMWYGASGEDEFIHKRLSEKFFPMEWVPKSVNEYKTYITNVLKIEFDDKESIKEWVIDIIKEIKK